MTLGVQSILIAADRFAQMTSFQQKRILRLGLAVVERNFGKETMLHFRSKPAPSAPFSVCREAVD